MPNPLLSESRPDLVACIVEDHPQNKTFDISKLTTGSEIRLWWRCTNQSTRLCKPFANQVCSRVRAKNGTLCRTCAGRLNNTSIKAIMSTPPTVFQHKPSLLDEFVAWDISDPAKRCKRPVQPESEDAPEHPLRGVSARSSRKAVWRCIRNEVHPNWTAGVVSRSWGASICSICSVVAKRKKECFGEQDNYKKFKSTGVSDVSDLNEIGVSKLMSNSGMFEDVERIGQLGSKFGDLIVQLNNTKYMLEVKTLFGQDGKYGMSHVVKPHYPDELLIMGIDSNQSIFALVSVGTLRQNNIKRHVSINVRGQRGSKNNQSVSGVWWTRNQSLLIQKLLTLLPTSVRFQSWEQVLSSEHYKEHCSLLRLQEKCSSYNLKLLRLETNLTKVDVSINGHNVQMKSSVSYKFGTVASFRSTAARTYDREDGFDFMICESTLHTGNFWIIPASILVQNNVIACIATHSLGQTKLTCVPPVGTDNIAISISGQHWTSEFWNRFDLLT